ncbi:MAG: DMT family transporter [Ruminococcus sp.]|nr:DMT family transporter [Ruminococcus sp.]
MEKNSILKKRWFACIGALICAALWGTAFPVIKLGYEVLAIESVGSKLLFAGERFALAGVFVFLFGLIIYRKPLVIKRNEILPIALLGFVQTTLQYLFAYVGVGLTTATNTSILTGTVSIISVVAAAVFFRGTDRLTPLKAAGCLVGLFGIVFVHIKDFSLVSATLPGDFIVLLSAFSGAGGNIIIKKISQGKNPAAMTAYQLFGGGLLLIIIGVIMGGHISCTNPRGIVILIWLSVVSSVSFLLWTALLKHHPVSRITIFTMLVPVFGTLWSWILLGENIFNIGNLVSLLLIAAGIVLVNIRRNR